MIRLAHWYGRPTHIHESQFDLEPLAWNDFDNDRTRPDKGKSAAITAFISLTRLSVVLADVLDNFYTVKSSSDRLSAEQALLRATNCQAQMTAWYAEYGQIWEHSGSIINSILVISSIHLLTDVV